AYDCFTGLEFRRVRFRSLEDRVSVLESSAPAHRVRAEPGMSEAMTLTPASHDTDVTPGELLKRAREEAALTLQEVADELRLDLRSEERRVGKGCSTSGWR